MKKAIFIAATGENVGKTTLCLGIIAGLQKRFEKVGFIKPVGQQHIIIDDKTRVDTDAVLFKEHFHLSSDWSDMSPVIVPPGFTRDYTDGKISEAKLLDNITKAFDNISSDSDYTVVEGTGHVGVGSIINLNNAKVAKELGTDMVIIASGGLGSAHDELSLNIAMCEKLGVNVRGVILNRVHDKKREMILDYFPRTLKKWNIPLIGCVPFSEFLSNPTIRDFEALFKTKLLSGEKHHYRHFKHTRMVAGALDVFLDEMIPNELIITPSSREDIIKAVLQKHTEVASKQGEDFRGGMILTGRHPPTDAILKQIRHVDIPVLYAPMDSYTAMKKITSYIAKIRVKDIPKIEKAITLVEKNIDFDAIT